MQNISQLLSQEIKDLIGLKQEGQKLYLVGGIVRDYCIGRKNEDVDILCDFDTRLVARRFADMYRGDFFVMDARRNISRVILAGKTDKRVFDFARLRATDLMGDLKARDFTINAMAIDLDQPYRILDPLGGQIDLEKKILRACSAASFTDDPVRVIRAFRYSHSLDLQFDAQTLDLLKEAIPTLGSVSSERKRDELFKILDLSNADIAINSLFDQKIHQWIGFPQQTSIAQFGGDFVYVRKLINKLNEFIHINEKNGEFIHDEFRLQKQTAEQLHTFLQKKNSSDRNEQQLILLSAILSPLEISEAKGVASRLLLSREEIDKLVTIKQRSGVKELWETRTLPGDRELYHYYRHNGDAGLDIALMVLAELWSGKAKLDRPEDLALAKAICMHTIAFWFERPNVAHPVLLI